MPGGDGTGPAGMGPMTGRAAGYCAGYPVPGYMNPIPRAGWGGFGYGRGWGRGFDWYGGLYPAYGYPEYDYLGYAYGYPYVPEMTSQEEAKMLKEQVKAMQENISSINDRIKELESAKKSEKK